MADFAFGGGIKMDEKKLAELIRAIVKEEVRAIVKEEIKGLVQDVAVLKQDVAVLKQDVAVLKQDVAVLKQDVAVLKQDVTVLKQDVTEIKQEMATKTELMSMEQRFTASLEKLREALRISMLEVHSDLEDIKVKLKMYDFDFLLKQNDYLAGVLKDLLEERKALSQRMKDFEERLKTIEAA